MQSAGAVTAACSGSRVYLVDRHPLQIPGGIALLISIQKLLVVAQQLIAYRGGLVVAGEVAHFGENAARKVDVATPPVGFIVALIQH